MIDSKNVDTQFVPSENSSLDFTESTNFLREGQSVSTRANTIIGQGKTLGTTNFTINDSAVVEVNRNKPWRKIIRRQVIDGGSGS